MHSSEKKGTAEDTGYTLGVSKFLKKGENSTILAVYNKWYKVCQRNLKVHLNRKIYFSDSKESKNKIINENCIEYDVYFPIWQWK